MWDEKIDLPDWFTGIVSKSSDLRGALDAYKELIDRYDGVGLGARLKEEWKFLDDRIFDRYPY